MFLMKDCRISECYKKNLLITLGKLAINNYPSIILEYNHQLSGELKNLMTTVINDLQICRQLKTRISKLQTELNSSSYDNKRNNNRIQAYKDSLELKKKRLKHLRTDNYEQLAKIGEEFFKNRLLNHDRKFSNVYSQLEDELFQGGCIKDYKNTYINKYINKVVNFIF
ncbi:hypothetical protein [Acetohalobium arabaticum]|uniref:Uncharacterized protein n=1 Tax=Acetohalobium arabaticum (strain ATCC 49924 / DSM 5501 / Z-7288) TaxID=574087 RepID=D9QQQ5_ACEAZ|nr:hypothetical protein [Acetohalobium arabaticum]ADL12846.1 hypothetical protein Acear_1333 [Acetohalobium arabaticum DSM 5501]